MHLNFNQRYIANQRVAKIIYITVLNGLLLSGCQTIPDTQTMIEDAEPHTQDLEIKGINKNFSSAGVDKVLNRLADSDEDAALLEKQLKITQGISNQPLIAGNDTELLFDGEHTFKAIFEAANSAKSHINLEYFIFENIHYQNETLEQLLIKKRNEGVSVNVIYDAFGSLNISRTFLDNLKNAGVKLTEYHSIDLENIHDVNHRDHRKMLIVDGKVAIVGGVNLSSTYQSKSLFGSSGASKEPKNAQEAYWRDTDLLIKGPAVAALQTLFLEHWDTNQVIDQQDFFPKQEKVGNEFIHVIGSSPKDDKHYFYATLVAAIDNAAKKIVMNSAYFVPTKDQKKSLIEASKRGAKVELILPGLSDSTASIYVQRSHYEDLLKSGIDIYEMNAEVLHAKTISVDGVWSVVGSSNFDYRSATLNEEVDVVVLGKKTANQLDAKFAKDIEKAKKIQLKEWKKRPFLDKVKERVSRIIEKLL
jgi:cardiolipin synthase A/B